MILWFPIYSYTIWNVSSSENRKQIWISRIIPGPFDLKRYSLAELTARAECAKCFARDHFWYTWFTRHPITRGTTPTSSHIYKSLVLHFLKRWHHQENRIFYIWYLQYVFNMSSQPIRLKKKFSLIINKKNSSRNFSLSADTHQDNKSKIQCNNKNMFVRVYIILTLFPSNKEKTERGAMKIILINAINSARTKVLSYKLRARPYYNSRLFIFNFHSIPREERYNS